MKKFLMIFIFLFVLGINVNADAGNNVRRKTVPQETKTSQSSGIKPYGLTDYLLLTGILGGLGYVAYQKIVNKKDVLKNSNYPASSPSKVVDSNDVINEIKLNDPSFSKEQLFTYASEVFVGLQTAWTKKDWKFVQQFETDKLFRTHEAQLQDYIHKHQTNYVDRINVKELGIRKFEKDEDFEYIYIDAYVIMRDYLKDDATNRLLEGSPNDDLYLNYTMVFSRVLNAQTQKILNMTQCHSCGAKNSFNAKGECEFCGNLKNHQWLLNDIYLKK